MVTHRCATVPTEIGVQASHSVLTRTLLLSFPFERWGNWGKEPNECGQHWIAGKVQSRFQRISLCQWLKHLGAWFHSLSLITMSWSLPTGCMFEKGPRQFYDDTCVVPEKFDGGSLSVSLFDFYECRMHFPLLKAVNICTSRCLWTSFIIHYKPVRLLGVPFAPPTMDQWGYWVFPLFPPPSISLFSSVPWNSFSGDGTEERHCHSTLCRARHLSIALLSTCSLLFEIYWKPIL